MNTVREKQPRIFISHASADREPARRVLDTLAQQGNARVFTTDMLSAGENWRDKLKAEITESDVFVVLLSPRTMESSLVLQELGAAWALGKQVVAILVDNGPVATGLDFSADLIIQDVTAPDLLSQIVGRSAPATEPGEPV